MLPLKSFHSYPTKTVYMAAVRPLDKPIDYVQFHHEAFSSYSDAQLWKKNVGNVMEVLGIYPQEVPDLAGANSQYDLAMANLVESGQDRLFSRQDLEKMAMDNMISHISSHYFITTPYVDAYQRSSYGSNEKLSFIKFSEKMNVQANSWEEELKQALAQYGSPNYAMHDGLLVRAFGEFGNKHFVYTDKLMEVNQDDIRGDWNVT